MNSLLVLEVWSVPLVLSGLACVVLLLDVVGPSLALFFVCDLELESLASRGKNTIF